MLLSNGSPLLTIVAQVHCVVGWQGRKKVIFLIFNRIYRGWCFLQSPLPDITAGIAINGPENNTVSIDGGSQYQIFKVKNGFTNITNLGLVNQAPTLGGAIWLSSLSTLSLEDVSVDECATGNCLSPIYLDAASEIRMQNCWMSNFTQGMGKSLFFESDGAFLLTCDDSVDHPFTIEGATTIQKQGLGTVELFASSLVAVQMMVGEGEIAFNGVTNQPINVGADGKLRGTLSCLYLVNEGVVGSGNSIGVITTTTDYYQTGKLEIALSSSGLNDSVVVGGNAFLDGELLLVAQPGLYISGSMFTILTTDGGISGNFRSVSATEDIHYLVHYFPNSVQVEIVENSLL